MRILYGVMGYGRGHAMRVAAVLPFLQQKHDVLLVGGRDAYAALSPRFDMVEIPTIGYAYGARQRISLPLTLKRNVIPLADLLLGGPGRLRMERLVHEFRPDLIISDSEAWSHRAGRMWGIPRISFDHVGVIAYCRPDYPPGLALQARRDGLGYRILMGWPERVLVSSFYPAAPRRPYVTMVGPVLREAAYQHQANAGEHLLVYLNKGGQLYDPRFEEILKAQKVPVRIYGTGRSGTSGNLTYLPPSEDGFLNDLASARAVVATAGHQLLSECLHYGKRVLALPENCFEQRLNAHMLARMGKGQIGELHRLTAAGLREFLSATDADQTPSSGLDARHEAVTTLERWFAELASPPSQSVPSSLLRYVGGAA